MGITDVRKELFGQSGRHQSRDCWGVAYPSPASDPAPVRPLVTFSRSGLGAPWAGQRYASLLEFAEACDVATRWACRSGVCHVCSTPTVSAEARYVNDPPVPPPAGEVLLCSCQPDGPIVLDM